VDFGREKPLQPEERSRDVTGIPGYQEGRRIGKTQQREGGKNRWGFPEFYPSAVYRRQDPKLIKGESVHASVRRGESRYEGGGG